MMDRIDVHVCDDKKQWRTKIMHRESIAPIEFTFLCIHIVSAKWKRKIFGDDASIQFVLGIPTSDGMVRFSLLCLFVLLIFTSLSSIVHLCRAV